MNNKRLQKVDGDRKMTFDEIKHINGKIGK